MTKSEILEELDGILTYQTPIFPIFDPDNRIYIKKEDAIPFSFGGNKCRIAASYFRELISADCDVVITYGSSSSNLCRVVANMAVRYGIKCVIVTPEELSATTCNSEMVELLGAERVTCPVDEVSASIDRLVADYKKCGKPYFIYGGGHGILGTGAYRNVLSQIVQYEKESGILFDYIFIPLATGTSMSGLIVENEVSDYKKKIVGISIARDKDRVCRIMSEALQAFDDSLKDALKNGNYYLSGDYRFGGYGCYDESVAATVREEFRTNGLYLDMTYTGKAFYGMKDYLHLNGVGDKNILFIHTGGSPLFFNGGCRYLNGKD